MEQGSSLGIMGAIIVLISVMIATIIGAVIFFLIEH
jgi:hypothetical protein